MANTRQELGRAFELIRKDQLEEAISIVKPITESEPQNADAWWLLANAASEPRDARRALVNVLKINPTYPKARDLLDKLSELHPPRDDELMMMMEIADVEPPPPGAEAGDTFADLDMSDDTFKAPAGTPTSEIDELFSGADADFDDFDVGGEDPFADLLAEDEKQAAREARRRKKGGGGRRRLLLLLLVILLGALAVVVLMGQNKEDTTPEVAEETGPSALQPIAPDAVNPENAEQLEIIRSTLESEVQNAIGPEAAAFYVQVEGGYALLVRVCAEPTPTLPRVAVDGMRLVAGRVGNTPAIQPDLAMVGVSVHDCTRNDDTLYRAMSPMAAVQTVAPVISNVEAFRDFQQTWVIER